jgi:hypothetical protein
MKYRIGKTAILLLMICIGATGCMSRTSSDNNPSNPNDSINRSGNGTQNMKDSQSRPQIKDTAKNK